MPLANAGTSPDPGKPACMLDHNGQLRYFSVPAECGHQGKSAAPSQHKPPVLGDIESSALRYAAGAPPVRVTPSLTVTSTATATLTGATVTVSSGLAAGQDALAFTSQSGITGSYTAATGVLAFTGTATVSAYATELRSVTYRDTNAAAPYGTRTISFQVSDGEPDNSHSNVESRTAKVTAKPPAAAGDKASTGKNAPVTISVLANDTDPAGLPLTIASVSTTGTKGTVTINPGQTITYNPNGQFAGLAAGKTATDKFTYKATDGTQTSNSATVTVTITGSSATPQPPTVTGHAYTAVGNTPLGVGTHPAAPAATVSGTLLTGDTDADPAATLSVTASTAPAHGTVTVNPDGTFTYLPNPGYTGADSFQATIAGSNAPAVTATETVIITVGTVVWYVNDSQDGGNGEAGSPFGTLTAATGAAGANSIIFLYQGAYAGGVSMQSGEDLFGQPHGLTVGGYSLVPAGGSTPAITNDRGNGIDLAEGADVEGVNVASPGGSGIAAANVNDATVGATTPVEIAEGGISIDGGDGNLNFGETSVGYSRLGGVSVTDRSGGTVTFGGPVNAPSVDLTSNAGAAIAFTGTLTLSGNEYGGGFTATWGGTITATGTGSTLTSLTQAVLTVQNTTIGAAGLTFQSASSNGSHSTGIDLANTGSSGGLTVTGAGTPGSGGTIQNSLEAGIQLSSTYGPSFTDMVIENSAADGINGSLVNGLTLAGSTISGSGAQAGLSGDGLSFASDSGSTYGLTGTVSITNSTITCSDGSNASISDSSGTLNLTVTGTTFSSSDPGSGDDGLDIELDSTANATVSVTGSTFTNNADNQFQFSALAVNGTNSVTFSNNTLNSTVTGIQGGGVDIRQYGNPNTLITVDGNNIQNATTDGIEIDGDAGAALAGAVSGNTIGAPGVTNSGGSAGIVVSAEGSGTETLAITGNHLYQYSNNTYPNGAGIQFIDQEGNPVMNLTITGNTIADPGEYGSSGILGQAEGEGTVCAAITGNSGSAQAGQGGADVELGDDRTTIELPGYTGAANDTSAVESFLIGNNDGSGTPTAVASGSGFVGATGC